VSYDISHQSGDSATQFHETQVRIGTNLILTLSRIISMVILWGDKLSKNLSPGSEPAQTKQIGPAACLD